MVWVDADLIRNIAEIRRKTGLPGMEQRPAPSTRHLSGRQAGIRRPIFELMILGECLPDFLQLRVPTDGLILK